MFSGRFYYLFIIQANIIRSLNGKFRYFCLLIDGSRICGRSAADYVAIADPPFLCANMESEDGLLKLVFNGDDFKGLFFKYVFHNVFQITLIFSYFL